MPSACHCRLSLRSISDLSQRRADANPEPKENVPIRIAAFGEVYGLLTAPPAPHLQTSSSLGSLAPSQALCPEGSP